MEAMCFVFNRDTISQAGRRRFEPGLPLFESIAYGELFFAKLPLLPLSDSSGGIPSLPETHPRTLQMTY